MAVLNYFTGNSLKHFKERGENKKNNQKSSISYTCSHSLIFLWPHPDKFFHSQEFMNLDGTHPDTPKWSHLRILCLIMSSKSVLPCKVAYAQVLEFKTWMFFEEGHFQGTTQLFKDKTVSLSLEYIQKQATNLIRPAVNCDTN